MRNYKLDTSLLPQVWVTWENTAEERFWLNCQTGKKKTTPELWMAYNTITGEMPGYWQLNRLNDTRISMGIGWYTHNFDKIWVNAGNQVKYMYAKYHADIGRLEIAAVGMKTGRTAEKRNWEFIGNRFFIGKDKSILTFNKDNVGYSIFLYKGHYAYSNNEIIRMLLRLNTYNPPFVNELKKFIGDNYFVIGNGDTVEIKQPWHLSRWYDTSQKARGKGKQQKLTDELTAIELSPFDWLADEYPVIETQERYSKKIKNIVYFERVNDDWSVLRSFIRNPENTLTENERIYIGDDGTVRATSKSAKGWVPSRHMRNYWSDYNRLVNKDEAIEKCNRIKYILESAGEIKEERVVDFLTNALRFPEIEQLTKFGYMDEANRVANSNTPKAELKNIFGGYYNEKEKTLLRKAGLTKQQLDFVIKNKQRYYSENRSLAEMRNLFGNNLSSMDQTSFEKYYIGCNAMCSSFWNTPRNYAQRFGFDYEKFFKCLVRLSNKHSNVYQVAKDTLNSYSSLHPYRRPNVDWYFDDYSDLTRMHDVVMDLKRIQDEEDRARWNMEAAERRKKEEEKRIKLDKERKVYEFEDAEYTIRLPKDCNEIAQEGVTQHICIGSYVSSHSNGHTNLFFLRKNSEPDKPFYAIEMSNDKSIVQIHGFGNKWLGNDPDAIPTVVRWLRKNGIKCDNKKLTCTAKGYGSCNDYVPMPVVE